MAERDPSVPQVNDPELETELVRILSIVGPLGKLNLLDIVIPTISLGDVVQRSIEIRQPSFRSTDIFSEGQKDLPTALTTLADTGALPAGSYDVQLHLTEQGETVDKQAFRVLHRNAADNANLSVWDIMTGQITGSRAGFSAAYAYELAINERLRIVNVLAAATASTYACTIFARRRT